MKITDVASRAELDAFTRKSDLRGAYAVLFNWMFIAGIFAACAWWTHPVTIALGLLLLGGRQLAFAALYHDAGHRLLFRTPSLNRGIGQWLCAYPVFADLNRYAKNHQRHHALAGSDRDPDLPNYQAYPITRKSFLRKVSRDLTGRTGLKALYVIWHHGRKTLGRAPWNGNVLAGQLLVNGAMFAALHATGHGWLYLMWPVSFLTVHMLIVRLRQVAEHGAVPDVLDGDPRNNTRTTYPAPWERLLLAPFSLNYHLEHHYLAAVPHYRLRRFHRFLKDRGLYEGTAFATSYYDLFAHHAVRW